jgi:hypothetical protein
MRKVITILSLFLFVTGCSLAKDLDNTPTKKVEALLNKYQTLDSSVMSDLNAVLENNTSFTDKQQDQYKDIIKKNYQNLTYTIKDSTTDGDEATVTAEIEVVDYTNALNDAKVYLQENPEEFETAGVYDQSKYIDYQLKMLKEAKEKVTYTLDFTLTKIDDEWTIDDLTDEIINKINGVYQK